MFIVCAISLLSITNTYDVIMPAYNPACECASWSKIAPEMFNTPEDAERAGTSCAMPSQTAGDHECDCGQKNFTLYMNDSYAGPWCFCTDGSQKYCEPPLFTPEQINLQVASPSVIVVGFVTYEPPWAGPVPPPQAEFGPSGSPKLAALTGVTHTYSPIGRSGVNASSMPYQMHYVRFNVTAGQSYDYKVRSGSSNGIWSAIFTFRAPATEPPTRLMTYGDLGHSHYNCFQNMIDDAKSHLIDGIVHMGDHAYNLGMVNDRRGDAYMNAFQPALTQVPWFPIIGNHEASDGDFFRHYEAIAFGEAYGLGDSAAFPTTSSSATTALGAHLSHGTFYAMGVHGPVPSNTSRFVSSDFGLVHMVGLDLNRLDAPQLAWLEEDLARANENRDNVPWIMVMSHFPIFHSKTLENAEMSAEHYIGDEKLSNYALDANDMDFVPCKLKKGCKTIGEFQGEIGAALQPLFTKYGVDIYNAGHVHSYESTWPICNFTTGDLCDGQQDFINPKGPVHITEGNGGVPGVSPEYNVANCTVPGGFCRSNATGGAYGRWTFTNATHVTYEHVQNNGGEVTDVWTIVQSKHGPF